MADQSQQPQPPPLIDTAAGEYAAALQELGKVLSGDFSITPQQGAAYDQNQGNQAAQDQTTQEAQGVQGDQRNQAAQDQTTQGAPPTEVLQAAQGEDPVLKILTDILSEDTSSAPAKKPTDIPLDAFRSREALDKLAESDPQAAYAVARLMLAMPQLLGQQQKDAAGAPPSAPPTPEAAPQADWGDPALKQLLDIRQMLETSINDIRKEIEESAKPPAAQPQPPAAQEDDLGWLFGDQQKAQATEARPSSADIQNTLRRMELFQRLSVLMGLLDRTQAEIQMRQMGQTLAANRFFQNAQQFLQTVQDVASQTTNDLNRLAAEINKHYGISPEVEGVITKAVRDELSQEGDIRKIIGSIAAEPDPNRRGLLREEFVRKVAAAYAKHAKLIMNSFGSRHEARIPPPAVPPPAPPAQLQQQAARQKAAPNQDDPFSTIAPDYVRDLESALKYLSGQALPQSLSRAKI